MSLFLDLDNLFQLMHSHLLYHINGIMLYFKKYILLWPVRAKPINLFFSSFIRIWFSWLSWLSKIGSVDEILWEDYSNETFSHTFYGAKYLKQGVDSQFYSFNCHLSKLKVACPSPNFVFTSPPPLQKKKKWWTPNFHYPG